MFAFNRDQENFEQLPTEWIVSCDQLFDEVKTPEFINMMNFTHHNGGPLKIRKWEGIKCCIVIHEDIVCRGEELRT